MCNMPQCILNLIMFTYCSPTILLWSNHRLYNKPSIHLPPHPPPHTHTHTQTHSCTNTLTLTCTRAHTHTHTHTLLRWPCVTDMLKSNYKRVTALISTQWTTEKRTEGTDHRKTVYRHEQRPAACPVWKQSLTTCTALTWTLALTSAVLSSLCDNHTVQ